MFFDFEKLEKHFDAGRLRGGRDRFGQSFQDGFLLGTDRELLRKPIWSSRNLD